jgi:hypothetical protein
MQVLKLPEPQDLFQDSAGSSRQLRIIALVLKISETRKIRMRRSRRAGWFAIAAQVDENSNNPTAPHSQLISCHSSAAALDLF